MPLLALPFPCVFVLVFACGCRFLVWNFCFLFVWFLVGLGFTHTLPFPTFLRRSLPLSPILSLVFMVSPLAENLGIYLFRISSSPDILHHTMYLIYHNTRCHLVPACMGRQGQFLAFPSPCSITSSLLSLHFTLPSLHTFLIIIPCHPV